MAANAMQSTATIIRNITKPRNLGVCADHLVSAALNADITLPELQQQVKRRYLLHILEEHRGNQCRAARALGQHRNTLAYQLRELGLSGEWRRIRRKKKPAGSQP